MTDMNKWIIAVICLLFVAGAAYLSYIKEIRKGYGNEAAPLTVEGLIAAEKEMEKRGKGKRIYQEGGKGNG